MSRPIIKAIIAVAHDGSVWALNCEAVPAELITEAWTRITPAPGASAPSETIGAEEQERLDAIAARARLVADRPPAPKAGWVAEFWKEWQARALPQEVSLSWDRVDTASDQGRQSESLGSIHVGVQAGEYWHPKPRTASDHDPVDPATWEALANTSPSPPAPPPGYCWLRDADRWHLVTLEAALAEREVAAVRGALREEVKPGEWMEATVMLAPVAQQPRDLLEKKYIVGFGPHEE